MSLVSDNPPAHPINPNGTEHKTEIMETSVLSRPFVKDDPYSGKTGNQHFPYLVRCACAWQALATTWEEADKLAGAHLTNRAIIAANQGIVEGRL